MKPEELAEKAQLALPESSLCPLRIAHHGDDGTRIHSYRIEVIGPRAAHTVSFTDNEIQHVRNQEFLVAKLREKQVETVETLIRAMEQAIKALRRWTSNNRPKTLPECLRCSAFGRYESDECAIRYRCLCPLAGIYPRDQFEPGPWLPRSKPKERKP